MSEPPDATGPVHEAWRVQIQTYCGRFNPEGVQPRAFLGRADHRKICGLDTLDIACNAHRIERTRRDVRLDGFDHYFAVLQIAGRSAIAQNDDIVGLDAGDVVLGDAARPVTFFCDNKHARWIAFRLPRRRLLTHLGFEPHQLRKPSCNFPARLLFQMAAGADSDEALPQRSDVYMNLAIYDLIGALFASPDPHTASVHGDRLFARICDIIAGRLAEPDLSPLDLAIEAGISLRYLQKLFAARGLSCNHYIQTARLDHAARLLRRAELLGTAQPLTEIAHACGFRDYPNFSRKYHQHFGHPPGIDRSGAPIGSA